ncbi:XRE family transcriptional regulator [Dysgonomonas capnocytophagoides]|uniref:XRE family transcriptional regulator n=1 Tax=Dysgonomonas capnocytophagoides TaxID=45254 RepID=A0A4Y8KX39_9BACT|nr:helix-turn-helix transcriptional regulator [Dysgonomonas capnocytophagoides]TFD94201.1 XRE family transcriptional regulator [Dysgonomonas capnocytophagoides]
MEETTVRKSNHGANVRRWREWRNINQDTLAEQIGVSQATLSSYEKKSKLDQEILEKITKALNIPLEAITDLGEDSAINIVASTLTANDNAAIFNYYPSFNPIDKIVELYDRLLQSEKEKVEILQEALKERK